MIFKAKKTLQDWYSHHSIEAVKMFLADIENDSELIVEISEPKKKRNLSQNALLHALFMEIDKLMHNYDPAKTKWQVLIEVGFYTEFEIKGNLEKLPNSTSKLDTKAFAELVDMVIKFAWNQYQVDLTPISNRGY